MNDNLDSFRDLAWRALENPADAALRAELTTVLTDRPEWADEWQALREAHAVMSEAVPAALAREQADRTEVIPAARLAALLPRQRQPGRGWWLGLAAALLLVAGGVFWQLRAPAAPDLTRWVQQAPPGLARALTVPLAELTATAVLPTLRAEGGLQLQSPLLAAAAGPVTVAWLAPVDTTVNVTLRENGRTIWTQAAVRPPVITPRLVPDAVYELLLQPTEGPARREGFVTVGLAGSPGAAGLDAVFAAATAEPARLGEAVLAWHALSQAVRHSEAGIRLGLWLGVEARQPDILAEAQAAAELLRR